MFPSHTPAGFAPPIGRLRRLVRLVRRLEMRLDQTCRRKYSISCRILRQRRSGISDAHMVLLLDTLSHHCTFVYKYTRCNERAPAAGQPHERSNKCIMIVVCTTIQTTSKLTQIRIHFISLLRFNMVYMHSLYRRATAIGAFLQFYTMWIRKHNDLTTLCMVLLLLSDSSSCWRS